MKLAAIDIGSNAIRMQIVRVFEEDRMVSFKKLEYLRFPLRLGHDVFKKKALKSSTIERFVKLMSAFGLLIDLYEVEGVSAVATSAMREAENGDEVRKLIKEKTGVNIDIISGEEEARILNRAIVPYLGSGTYLHVDVGGGSTEINVFEDKVLKKSKSFQMGSVRKLDSERRKEVFTEINEWVADAIDKKTKNITGVGSGGNINKLFKLSHRVEGNRVSLVELKAIRAYVSAYTIKQRMAILKMNPDRADVIIPASEIYITILQSIGCDEILVPKAGLKDGLIYELFERVSGHGLEQYESIEEF